MDDEQRLHRALADGTSRQHRRLLQQSEVLTQIQRNSSQLLDEHQALHEQLYTLRQRRKHLEQQVQDVRARRRTKTLRQKLAPQVAGSKAAEVVVTPVNAGEDTHKHALAQMSQAYRLSGKSVFRTDDNLVGVRLETFYDGRYHESYYIMLRQGMQANKLEIARHTIPSFVPLSTLAKALLHTDLNALLDQLDDHLQAFVARREQMVALQASASAADVAISTNDSFTYVQLDCGAPHNCSVYLAYDDLRSALPTRASVVREQPQPAQNQARAAEPVRLRDKETPFLQSRLLAAFEEAFVVNS